MSRAKQKSFVRKGFTEAKIALKDVMQTNVALIADDLIKQIMTAYNAAIPSQEINSAKNLKIRGTQKYKDELRNALSIISLDALERARKEVPSKKGVRLSEWHEDRLLLAEFERLPPKVQKKILAQSQLIIDTQTADLEKAIYFQFSSSVDSTDSPSILQSDLEESATDFLDGPSIEAGAGTISSDFINTARNAFFFDDTVLEGIEAFEFINGDPVSPICQDLAGTIFAKDDPEADRYFPPLHHNCKSTIMPILSGNLEGRDLEKLKPSSSKLDKYVTL